MPYNPQQNWVTERKNKAITGTAKAIIRALDLPMCLWVEVCCIAVYILNRCLHKILKDKTPNEDFTGEKPYVSHYMFLVVLHIFIFLRRKGPSWNLLL